MDGRMVEGVVAVIPRGGRMLVIRRAEGIRAGGWWCLPGGAVEPGETVEQALVREVQEELSLAVRPVKKLWEWARTDGTLLLHWWLAEPVDEIGRAVPNPAEVAEARFVSPAEFRSLHPVLESNLLFLEHYERTCESS